MPSPLASLSIDLDNKWAYLRAHGLAAWAEYPSYLPRVSQRIADLLGGRGLGATTFVVGRDLEAPANREAVALLAGLGDLANHTYNHVTTLESLSAGELEDEVARAEGAIADCCGDRPVGFRGPGFSRSPQVLRLLAARGYAYDASRFPTSTGALASLYFRGCSRRGPDAPRPQRFGALRDAWGPLRPHPLEEAPPLVEVPVTTVPLARLPMHMTYLSFLAQGSPAVALGYFRAGLRLCRLRGVAPSFLLHPLDFLGADDEPDLAFFPGMRLAWGVKERLLHGVLDALQDRRRVVPLTRFVELSFPRPGASRVAAPATPAGAPR